MSTESPRRKKQLVYKTVTVPGNLEQACREFNSRLYFECHETLEEIWQEEQGEVRDLYKGLIQVAAGFVHITRNNHFGAKRLLTTALGYLEPYRAEGAMGGVRDLIGDERIARHLREATIACPIFGRFHKGCPNAMQPGIGIDPPAFNVSDGR